ncbi:MAG: ATP synthase F1 subunit gamma [Dehalococcoidia bacterium]|nr:ATP synthase F1 subunit gamma [Dehalococcoidia bacterium]MCA9829322.1 ATP synthase F1 subunit gamma [Dehalococcoidia bacterium]MCB9485302.1 ATP synthase F1 subunit gamma [Thermoflexaceae bacterium]
MPNIRQLKRRIGTVKNTAKITNALQLVAASKMRRAQDRALQSRPYADKLSFVLAGLATKGSDSEEAAHPLLISRPVENVAVLHITPNRGLCGGLNSNLNRAAGTFVAAQEQPVNLVAVGKKGRDFFVRARASVVAEFVDLGDYPTQSDTLGISRLVIDDYLAGVVDRVYLSYASFVSTAVQRPVVKQLLPLEPPKLDTADEGSAYRADYIFEPGPEVVLERLLPRYIEMVIYSAILESAASEQSARMVAMKNASDNASEIERELTLTYNKARQEQITTELLDIIGGAAALED